VVGVVDGAQVGRGGRPDGRPRLVALELTVGHRGPARLRPFVITVASAAAGAALYFGLLWLFREGEITNLWNSIAGKLLGNWRK